MTRLGRTCEILNFVSVLGEERYQSKQEKYHHIGASIVVYCFHSCWILSKVSGEAHLTIASGRDQLHISAHRAWTVC